jgi:hypothetical protein
MPKSRDSIGGPFVPLLKETLAAPAWRATSHGARSLYVALKLRNSDQTELRFYAGFVSFSITGSSPSAPGFVITRNILPLFLKFEL